MKNVIMQSNFSLALAAALALALTGCESPPGLSCTVVASPNPGEVNETITFKISSQGGTAPYRFALEDESPQANGGEESRVFTTLGENVVKATVVDATNATAQCATTVAIQDPSLQGAVPSLKLTATPHATADLSGKIHVSAVAAGLPGVTAISYFTSESGVAVIPSGDGADVTVTDNAAHDFTFTAVARGNVYVCNGGECPPPPACPLEGITNGNQYPFPCFGYPTIHSTIHLRFSDSPSDDFIQVTASPANDTPFDHAIQLTAEGTGPGARAGYQFTTSEPGISIDTAGSVATLKVTDGRPHSFEVQVRTAYVPWCAACGTPPPTLEYSISVSFTQSGVAIPSLVVDASPGLTVSSLTPIVLTSTLVGSPFPGTSMFYYEMEAQTGLSISQSGNSATITADDHRYHEVDVTARALFPAMGTGGNYIACPGFGCGSPDLSKVVHLMFIPPPI